MEIIGNQRNQFVPPLSIAINLLSFYGGLLIVLRFVVPSIIKFLHKIGHQCARRTHQQIPLLPTIEGKHISHID